MIPFDEAVFDSRIFDTATTDTMGPKSTWFLKGIARPISRRKKIGIRTYV